MAEQSISEAKLLTAEELARPMIEALGSSIRKTKLAIVTLSDDGTNPAPTGYIPVQITGQPETYHAPYNSMTTPLEVLKTGVQVELFENEEGELEVLRLYTKQPLVQNTSLFGAMMANQLKSSRDASHFFLGGSLPAERLTDDSIGKSKLYIIPPEDTTVDSFQQRRLVIDYNGGSGTQELSYLKDTIGDSVHPTVNDDQSEGNRNGSNWLVTGGGYDLYYELLNAAEGAADWYAKNPKHNTTTTNPTVTSDLDALYIAFRSTWYNSSTGTLWRCVDHTPGAAVWVRDGGTILPADLATALSHPSAPFGDDAPVPAGSVFTDLTVNDFIYADGGIYVSTRLNLPAAPVSPVSADLWYDNTRVIPTAHVGGLTGQIPIRIYEQMTNKTVGNTTTETTLVDTTSAIGTVTLPANFMVLGRKLILEASGYFSADAVAADFIFNVYIGSIQVYTVTRSVSATTNRGWHLKTRCRVSTAGSSGVVWAQGELLMSQSPRAEGKAAVSSAINFTTTQAVDLRVDFSAADPDHTVTLTELSLYAI
jgi:hypothetical protein